MNNCAVCHKPVVSGLVVHSECWPGVALDNKPLTIEELREMDGEPVWAIYDQDAQKTTPGFVPLTFWALVEVDGEAVFLDSILAGRIGYSNNEDLEYAGITIYRCKPSEWVSIKNRRPDGECLAISMVNGPTYKEYLVGFIGESEESVSGYVCESDGETLYNVTHWMPKPEPPEVERINGEETISDG